MRRLLHILLLAVCLPLLPSTLSGQVQQAAWPVVDSTLTVSLLTCSPGQETYELYGHTAIRVQWQERVGDTVARRDLVYNYGLFDFEQPHFTWHFTLGECDYIVAPTTFDRFLQEYAYRGSSVTEQVLRLKPYEAKRLFLALDSVCRPENRGYRYHIFRNNCTTKTRDIMEANIYGHVIYPARPRRNTYRTILHEFTQGHDWAREGNDLLLGSSADTALTERDEQFSPIYLMHYMDSAFVDRGRTEYAPLVLAKHVLLEENPVIRQRAYDALPDFPLSPRATGWLLLGLGLCLAAYELLRHRICWPLDALLMTLQGLAGCLIVFMMLFSEHPTVGSNWQVWVLNPLPLFFIYAVVRADLRHERCIYHAISAVLLGLFLVLYFFIPQDFSELILPLALLLLSRALVHLHAYRTS